MPEVTPRNLPMQRRMQNLVQSATRKFVIAQREPWGLPEAPVEFPSPPPSPGQPPQVNLLTAILPGVLMLVSAVVMIVVGSRSGSGGLAWTALPMVLMSVGFPAASLIGYSVQKKKYKQQMEKREADFKAMLEKEHTLIRGLLQEQRTTMEREYPVMDEVARIAFSRSKRLWWRRPGDSDFLSLRMGTGAGRISFAVNPPRSLDPNDPLTRLGLAAVERYKGISDVPLLVPLLSVGSTAIAARSSSQAMQLANRLLLDLIVHHSPQDVHLAVLSDTPEATERWGWLKWAPHTAALIDEKPRRLNFSPNQIDDYLKWLVDEFNDRSQTDPSARTITRRRLQLSTIVVLMDDSGIARQTPEIAQIAECGHEFGIHLIFAGGSNWPRECRSRIDIVAEREFKYMETWDTGNKAAHLAGRMEVAGRELCERVARSVAGLEVVGAQSTVALPESIRLSQVLGTDSISADIIKQRWSLDLAARDQLRFPVGVFSGREGLEPLILDLRPEELGGQQAFHTVLIGTTGSGKSVFLQSLILGAGFYYSPRFLNFLLMDFKAGASELSKLRELPHVVGMVTDLNAEMAARSLVALDSEIQRRKRIFDEAGKISDIWAYNKRFPENPMPHLVLVLDEFAKGVEILPDLQRVLQTLSTQGRALGMYLLLANQKVTGAVDALLANIGWRIALRVSEKDEMRIVDPTKPRTERPGRGYIRVKEDVTEFQGSRSDQTMLKASVRSVDEFHIYSVETNGELRKLYTHTETSVQEAQGEAPKKTELESLTSVMIAAQKELAVKPARQIYLDPLPEKLHLVDLLEESVVKPCFANNRWMETADGECGMIAPLGYLDVPDECLQEMLEIDFHKQDGHLWVVGAPGSGKSMTLTSLVTALALTHTPRQVHFYVMEFGSGALRQLEALPHVGSVIRLQEKEKIQRFISFLDAEIDQRTAQQTMTDVTGERPAEIFLVINNFAEMRSNYPDEAEHISRYIRDGKATGVHCIISTNRGAELSRAISSNISRRLVLQLASRDEYMDVIGKIVPPLSCQAEGRGYWVDCKPNECQVGTTEGINLRALIKEMGQQWQGAIPRKIIIMPSCVSMAELTGGIELEKMRPTILPMGISYDLLDVIMPDLEREMPQWLILGPRASGKSNFLACVVSSFLKRAHSPWEILGIGLKRSMLGAVEIKKAPYQFIGQQDKINAAIQTFVKKISAKPEKPDKKYMFLIDDLGGLLDLADAQINDAFNQLIDVVSSRRDTHLMASGLLDELRSHIASAMVKFLRQGRTGLVLSKDTGELDWLGAQFPLEYRKVDMPTGRGFYVSKGRQVLLQTASLEECTAK